ncbi:MAG: PDZ domain-containing protein, partial [Lentisphaeria bacterium]|nr:PDZ domain-containing protein [Lentisphaeria bacterium]
AGVMKKFGGMLLLPQEKVDLNIPLVSRKLMPLTGNLGEIIWSAEVGVYPGKLKITVFSDILIAAMRSFHDTVSGSTLKKGVPELLFDLNGNLLGVNLLVRAFNYNRVCPFVDIAEVENMLDDPRELVPFQAMCNPPDSVGYLGVEYQTLNQELVRSVNLEHLTYGGREGLLISYVYPDSPAEKIGLKAGDILLKLIVPGGGAPISLTGKNFNHVQERQFPWKNLDAIPEMYFSEIPEPWKGVKNPLASQLANIGIGRKITLIIISQGRVKSKELVIANAPVYFETAPTFRSGALGLDVKNMTFEVRRYFRMAKDIPGVIISDVYAGKSASVAGLRPFEIITAVNDQPVYNVEDFQKAVAGKSEVRLAVRRLAVNRVVTVKSAIGPLR